MQKQFNKEDLKLCRLTRYELARAMNMKYSTFSSKVNGYISFYPEELERLRRLLRENQLVSTIN